VLLHASLTQGRQIQKRKRVSLNAVCNRAGKQFGLNWHLVSKSLIDDMLLNKHTFLEKESATLEEGFELTTKTLRGRTKV